jgi:hypothetical protein
MAAYPRMITESYCNLPGSLPRLAATEVAVRFLRFELANALAWYMFAT